MESLSAEKGISRSGRVRKKSTKLNDFESEDDPRPKRKAEREFVKISKSPKRMVIREAMTSRKVMNSDVDSDDDSDPDLSGDFDDIGIDIKDEPLDMEMDDWNDDDDDDDDDDNEDLEDPGNLQIDEDSGRNYSQAHSLYFSEKKGKKSARRTTLKAERKDKGKSRFTAYMLWSREVRPNIVKANPSMDFATVNKRLGELWALVPPTQKYNWKRRAKRLATKKTTSKTPTVTGAGNGRTNVMPKGGGGGSAGRSSMKKVDADHMASPMYSYRPKGHSPKSMRGVTFSPNDMSPTSGYKVVGYSSSDVAAHIKLLGESLNNIGQKLKEHEGQIAVSGSLSVLLDSMLCVLGPLSCLTAQIEPLQDAIPATTLTSILDNIAYIMPGIV